MSRNEDRITSIWSRAKLEPPADGWVPTDLLFITRVYSAIALPLIVAVALTGQDISSGITFGCIYFAVNIGLTALSTRAHQLRRHVGVLRRLFNIVCLCTGPQWLGADSAVWLLGLLIVASITLLEDAMVAVPLATGSSLAALGGMFWAGSPSSAIWIAGITLSTVSAIALTMGVYARRKEQELTRALKATEQGARAKAAFLANMSHEIRTPMNGVVGMTSILLGTPLNQEQALCTQTIKDSADALLAVINDILDYSKAEAGALTIDPTPTRLEPLVADLQAMLGPAAAGKGLLLSCELDIPHLDVLVDAGRLRQILTNLLSNAIKFTQEGSVRLRVVAENQIDDNFTYRFEVTDSGIGIAENAESEIFDEFVQAESSTTRRFGGTGLGLAISKRLVVLMGGDIGVRSKVGQGSTFWFTVPMCRSGALPGVQPTAWKTDTHLGFQVLVAEDNLVNQLVITRLLEGLGCETTVVNDGTEAVDAATKGNFDVILMDCHMPKMNGFDATRIIRMQELSSTPIIALTASVMEEDAHACLDAGMNLVLAKPIDRQRLATGLTQVVEPIALCAS